MKRAYQTVLKLTLAFGLAAILVACGGGGGTQTAEPQPAPEPAAQPQAVVEEEELDTIEVPEIDHALITFVTGDAWLQRDGDEFLADIGDYLQPGEQLTVDTGYVELQAGNLGSVRVQEATTIRLDDIVIDPAGGAFDLRVVSGSVLNKVNRLAGNDTYEVRTETAVMGVRGTEFGVNVDENTGTRVAVREGRVALVPPAADPQRLRERAAQTGEAAEAVEAAIQRLEDEAPVIEPNQEAELNQEDAAAAEMAVQEIEQVITEVETQTAQGQTVDVAQVQERLNAAAEQTASRVQEETSRKRQNISEASRQELQQIDDIRVIPVAARTTSEETGQEAEPAPTLVPVRVRVEPADARIALDGRPVGAGRFSAVFLPGEDLTFTITRDGYVDETLSLTVDENRGRAYTVSLAERPPEPEPEPEPVALQVSVEPADAEIFIDGDAVGTGAVTREFPPETEVAVRAELDGYDSAEQTVTVSNGMEPVSFSLQRSIAGIRVEAEPPEAEIRIDGEVVGTGSATVERPLGDVVQVEVALDGYRPAEREVTVEGTADAVRFQLEQLIGTLDIEVTPRDAEILLNGRSAGRGSVSREFPAGQEISVTIRRQDYATVQVPVTIQEGENPLRYELSRDLGTLNVSVTPASAQILFNGSVAGTGTVQQQLPSGQEVTVSARQDGYVSQERTVTVGAGTTPLRFSLERQMANLTVTAQPADAAIRIDGRAAGTGRAQRQFPVAQRVTVQASRPGFADIQRSVVVEAGGSSLQLRLDPRPIEATVDVAPTPLVRALASDGQRAYGADQGGTVYAVDPAGTVAWSADTGNTSNENSMPVVSDGVVAFSGAAELVMLNASSGAVLSRSALSGSGSHLFGRRPVAWGNRWLLPSDEALTVLDAQGNPTGTTIPVPGGSKMTPAVVSGSVVIADQQGQVLVIDPSSGAVQATVPTGMSQPVALAPASDGARVFMVGRRGVATAVDIASGSQLWEQSLAGGRGAFVDPVVAGATVFYYTRAEIVALNTDDGSQRFVLTGAAGSPVALGGSVYYGTTAGELRRINPATGAVTARLRMPAGIAGAPVAVGERLIVPLASGQAVVVHPAGM